MLLSVSLSLCQIRSHSDSVFKHTYSLKLISEYFEGFFDEQKGKNRDTRERFTVATFFIESE